MQKLTATVHGTLGTNWEGRALGSQVLGSTATRLLRAAAKEKGALFLAERTREDRQLRRGASHYQRLDRTQPGRGCPLGALG